MGVNYIEYIFILLMGVVTEYWGVVITNKSKNVHVFRILWVADFGLVVAVLLFVVLLLGVGPTWILACGLLELYINLVVRGTVMTSGR